MANSTGSLRALMRWDLCYINCYNSLIEFYLFPLVSPHDSGCAFSQVLTLPGLELILEQRMEEGLTFPWAWGSEALNRLCAVDHQGQLAMVSILSAP